MRRTSLVLGLISSIAAIILAATSYFGYVYIPVIVSLILGFVAFNLAKKHEYPTKPVQFIFIIAIIAISMALYRSVYSNPSSATTEIIDTSD